MSGDWLALGAVAGLAALGMARRRGSRTRAWPGLLAELRQLQTLLEQDDFGALQTRQQTLISTGAFHQHLDAIDRALTGKQNIDHTEDARKLAQEGQALIYLSDGGYSRLFLQWVETDRPLFQLDRGTATAGVLSRYDTLTQSGPGSRAKWSGPREAVKESARRLRSELGLADVRIGESTIYLLGAPKRLERLLTVHDPETGRLLHTSKWRLAGLLRSARAPASSEAGRRVRSSTIDSYVENATHWDGLYGVVELFMAESGARVDPDDENYVWTVYVVPSPGAPQELTWSAKANKLIPVESVAPFQFCEASPTVSMGHPAGPAVVNFGGDLPPIFVSHGIQLQSLKAVDKCGGFLWPSFAVTWRQPTSYGDLVFLAPAAVLPMALTTKKTPFYLAPTDIWSPTAKELTKRQAEITAQLRGESDRGLQNDLLISTSAKPDWDNLVGNMSWSFGGDVDLTDKLTKRDQLVRALHGILADHVVDDDPYVYPPRPEWDSYGKYRYPYAELKVLGLVPVRAMTACFYPRRNARRVNAFLDRHGFGGFRVSFDWTGPGAEDLSRGREQHDAIRRDWASTVTSAIGAWASRPCAGRNVKIGHLVSDPNRTRDRSSYNAVLNWTRSRQPYIDTGDCGTKK